MVGGAMVSAGEAVASVRMWRSMGSLDIRTRSGVCVCVWRYARCIVLGGIGDGGTDTKNQDAAVRWFMCLVSHLQPLI